MPGIDVMAVFVNPVLIGFGAVLAFYAIPLAVLRALGKMGKGG
jgi:hypothetical protein